MNLVAKEYVATKCDNPGVLILSEMAGAAVELTDAIQINPNDTEQIENAICQALEMPEEEQKAAPATYAKYSVCTDSQQMGSRLCQ